MEAGIPAGLTAAQGRRFGLTVGGAFLALAAVLWWRGHLKTAASFAMLGGALSLAALVIPARLGPVERAWMSLAKVISKVTTPIVMGVMYLLVLTPFGLARRAFGGNPLVHRPGATGFWQPRPAGRSRGNLTRQF
jgi:hypothetical protein